MDRPETIASAIGLTVGLIVLFAARSMALSMTCECASTAFAASVASACLGTLVGVGAGNRVLARLRVPRGL